MRKRTRSTSNNPVAKVKKQCFTHTAQRKFAANVPLGSNSKEALQSSQGSSRKTEDFIDFLCFRSAPHLTPGLEVFAEPSKSTPNHSDNDIFESEMEMEDSTAVVNNEECEIKIDDETIQDAVVTKNPIDSTKKPIDSTKKPIDSTKRPIDSTKKENDVVLNKTKKVFTTFNVDALQPSATIFKDIFCLLEYSSKKQQSVFLLTPPSDWKTLSFIQEDLMFTVTTKHIHRLKLPVCDNFVTLHCIKKQLEKDCVKMNEIPLMGLCEIDLAYLMEIVDMFGGVQSVNSDQNWKALADQLCIPKNASRRVSRLEDIYLKYILPYALQSDSVKNRIKNSVFQEIGKLKEIPKEQLSTKKVSLETFHRMACNGQYLYWKNDVSYNDTENQLWKLVNDGNRHVTAVCGELDLNENPQAYQNPKCKVAWKHSTLYSHPNSALRFVGKLPEISVPKLLVEGTFWVSEWLQEDYGFYTLSYLHSGAEKIWYVIPKHCANTFEKLYLKAADENSFLTPEQILFSGCGVLRCVQKEGQYIVIEPGCYYCTLSTGYSLSEVVCLASMDWFTSSSFKEHKLILDDFVVVKALLNYATEETKAKVNNHQNTCGDNSSTIVLLIEKLEQLHTLVEDTLEKLSKKGLENVSFVKSKPNEPENCTRCGCYCYLFVIRSQNDDDLLLCVNDAVKMLNLKRVKSKDLAVSALISPTKINQLKEKLIQSSQKKKNN